MYTSYIKSFLKKKKNNNKEEIMLFAKLYLSVYVDTYHYTIINDK